MLRDLVLDNDPECVSDVVETLLQNMGDIGEESARFHLRLGIHEMLMNAIEHGNLEISSQEKRDAIETDQYDWLLSERRRDQRYTHRRVRVHVTHDREQGVYVCCIKDEGQGFDWRQRVADQSPSAELNGGCGRGIALTKNATETLSYNDLGNEVTLTVRITT